MDVVFCCRWLLLCDEISDLFNLVFLNSIQLDIPSKITYTSSMFMAELANEQNAWSEYFYPNLSSLFEFYLL